MDPDANLNAQLELVRGIQAYADSGDKPPAWMAIRLAELVEALDGWIVKGGFEPRRWRKRP